MKLLDKVYVIDWGKQYGNLIKWVDGKKVGVFNIKTKIPDYSGTNYHCEHVYEPNLTLKGTVNKREPKKFVKTIEIYRDFKYEIVEIVKHPDGEDLYLLASTHREEPHRKCYVLIGIEGISLLTPEQYKNEQFNAMIEANLGKHDRDTVDRRTIQNTHKAIISSIYDANDRVLFGSTVSRGKVQYHYLAGEFSTDGKPIYLGSSVLYDGIGNADLPEEANIMNFDDIKMIF